MLQMQRSCSRPSILAFALSYNALVTVPAQDHQHACHVALLLYGCQLHYTRDPASLKYVLQCV